MLMWIMQRGLVYSLLGFSLVACNGFVAKPMPAPVVEALVQPEPARQLSAAGQRQQLRVMLANAQQALADDRLMVPEFDSAYDWYRQVLAVDQENAEAHWGMHEITRRYLQLAEQAFDSHRLGLAEQMLRRAEMIAANPLTTEAIRQRYKQTVRTGEVLLPVGALSARNELIQQQLAELAQQARAKQSRLLIVARNDAEGRWVYQQMRSAVDGFRLRGNIEIGQVPRIVLLDLD
ncbi:hypothetical protein [Oceanicoccus sp. KOV_DT_Chl]|uniref:hypothetical protein n=1 Tax=Oceanicoccus sp. KOV_DT_Chl TaxID=1904639 RepID=UPI0011AEEBE1|nr:hypothetical protein [Oceanicoccus sp. KOV_DT_Chl]